MVDVFLKIVNMSIASSWIVLVVLLLRLFLKKAPKWINGVLWGIVGVRLIMPFSIESIFSLIPSSETISPEIMIDRSPTINSGVPLLDNIVNPVIGDSFTPDLVASANPLQILIHVFTMVWMVGIAVLLIYLVISYLYLAGKVGTAVLLRDNIYQSENVVSPFVLGIINPKIYLPFNMNQQTMEHVIAHEREHISRKDHWWKPFGFLILTLHWFNPLIWFGYGLLCRDIELACDEKVVKEFDSEQKADYSQALLACSVKRHIISACPLAFGEIGLKERVKSVLNYKKPALWIIAVAIVISIALGVCFLTTPKKANDFATSSESESTDVIMTDTVEIKEKTIEDAKTIGEALELIYPEVAFDTETVVKIFIDSEMYDDKYANIENDKTISKIIDTVKNAPLVSYETKEASPGPRPPITFYGEDSKVLVKAWIKESYMALGAGGTVLTTEGGYFAELSEMIYGLEK